uniref:T-complex protein 11-like protein 1 n=1 Tax=Phallusia mammillata TaxID=59560 RepID=A0A6F9DV33_9ASCI|nr:T-complex protein 11-like protein 1 [Phallusia mammillata]
MSDKNKKHLPAKKRDHDFKMSKESKSFQSENNPIPYLLKGHFGIPPIKVSPSSSPPNKKSLSIDEFSKIKASAWNMTMAHEIALQGNSKVFDQIKPKQDQDESNKEKLHRVVKEEMHKAYWQLLRDELHSSPPVFDHAFVIIKDVKEMMVSLLADNRVTSLHKKIDEIFDIELLKQQAKHSALDVRKLSVNIIDTIAAMCAPIRDKDVAELYSIDDTVDLFRKIFDVMEIMKQDKINALVSAITPHIQKHHIQYEREKFNDILSKLPEGPIATERWLQNTHRQLLLTAEMDVTNKETNKTTISPLTLLKVAFTKLLDWNHSTNSFPETIAVDQERFINLQKEFQRVILTATLILTSLTTLSSDLSSHQHYMQTLKKNLLILLSDIDDFRKLDAIVDNLVEQIWKDTNEYAQTYNSVSHAVEPHKKKLLQEQLISLTDIKQNHVFKLLEKRAITYLLTITDILEIPASGYQIPPAPSALKVIGNELQNLGVAYAKLVNLNRLVYGPFYSTLLKKIIGLPQPNISSSETSKSL